ncbi:MAG: DUF4271 domain-containing protein [Bacteroidia bacterium]
MKRLLLIPLDNITSASDTTLNPSLFTNHLLEVKDNHPLLHFTKYDYVVGFVLLLSYLLFVWLYVTNRKRLHQTITGLFIYHASILGNRNESAMNNRITFFLFLLFLLTSTSFIIQTELYYNVIEVATATIYISAFLIISVIYSTKIIVTKWMGLLFQTQKEAEDYILNLFLFCNALGLFLLPIVIGLTFVKQFPVDLFIKVGFIIITLLICSRLIRGLLIGFKSVRISKFYLFLYLCTLEVVPFLIIAKILMMKIS